ncbi:MAG TPA: hypothetical protein VFW87_06815 [Pirellulales bacterium]|jgi:hypothetical protein|nr:hypothetical protein [Pirellulales bacterium]
MQKLKLVEVPAARPAATGGRGSMATDIFSSLDWSAPPKDMSKPLQALWWAKKGGLHIGPEWEEAHAIVQSMEGVFEFDWVHALLHWIEADMGNADYWYRRAGKKRATASVAAEWQHIAATLSGVTRH